MVDTGTSRNHKTDERCRRAILHLVCKYLDDSDEEEALVGTLHPAALAIRAAGCKYKKSPITLALRRIKNSTQLKQLFPNHSDDADWAKVPSLLQWT